MPLGNRPVHLDSFVLPVAEVKHNCEVSSPKLKDFECPFKTCCRLSSRTGHAPGDFVWLEKYHLKILHERLSFDDAVNTQKLSYFHDKNASFVTV